MSHIFIVDDEKNIRDILGKYLIKEGFRVTSFPSGEHVLEDIVRLGPDLLVLDIMMPGIDGLELCKAIRKVSDIPIIFVSARDEELDRILGLEIGGDDYLTKPFSPRELVVRIKNIFKRVHVQQVRDEKSIILSNLTLHPTQRIIEVNGAELNLTTKEYELLTYFILNKNKPFSREQLIENIWGYQYIGDGRMIDDLVKRIRKKLKEKHGSVLIKTIWGFGYRLDEV